MANLLPARFDCVEYDEAQSNSRRRVLLALMRKGTGIITGRMTVMMRGERL